MQIFDYHSVVTMSANWQISDWSVTLFAHRTGFVQNWALTKRFCSRTAYN